MGLIKGQKLNSLTLKQKTEIIEKLNCGFSLSSLAKKYNVAKSTVFNIKKQSKDISLSVVNTFSGPGNKKRMARSEFPLTEHALYGWFLRQRERNAPVNGPTLKRMAREFFCRNEGKNQQRTFYASDGWLQNFRRRFGIRHLTISGEKASAKVKLVDPFKKKLNNHIKELGLKREQLYNADETGLFWRMLPNKTYVSANEKTAPGTKIEKQRFTAMFCANATGDHKLKCLVIGKANKPRSFKNSEVPVVYKSSKTAWMTSFIFKEWFHNTFVPEVCTYYIFLSDIS